MRHAERREKQTFDNENNNKKTPASSSSVMEHIYRIKRINAKLSKLWQTKRTYCETVKCRIYFINRLLNVYETDQFSDVCDDVIEEKRYERFADASMNGDVGSHREVIYVLMCPKVSMNY